MSTDIVPYEQMQHMATTIAKSNLFGVKTPEQALALMVIAQAEGRHPGTVANEYHIIQGRPSLKADTLLERYIAAGGTVKWTSYTADKVAAIFTHPASGSVEVEWTMNMARAAGLANKDNWKAFPRAMLRARVISEGVRTSYPGVAKGMYTSEEVSDMPPPAAIDVTPREAPQEPRAVEGVVVPADDASPIDAANAPKANDGQLRIIRKKLDNAGVPENAFLEQFSIERLEDLPFDSVNNALTWIAANAP